MRLLVSLSILILLASCKGQVKSQSVSSQVLNEDQAIPDTVELLGNNIMVIYQDMKNRYWFGSWEDGLYRYDGKTILHYTTKSGLPHNRIDEIQEDKSGNLYLNTSVGISKFDGQKFVTLTPSNHLNNEWKLNPDDLWFKNSQYDGEVYRYDGINLHRLQIPKTELGEEYLSTRPNYPNPYGLYCIFKDSRGNVWFGTGTLGVCRYNGKTFDWISEEDVTEIHEGPANGVRSIAEDKDAYFWFNTMFRYKVYNNQAQSTKFYSREEGIGSLGGKKDGNLNEYLSIVKDNHNELWIVTYNEGVWRYDGKNITQYPVQDQGKNITLFSIYKDNKGDLWLGSHANGAYKWNGKTFERFKL